MLCRGRSCCISSRFKANILRAETPLPSPLEMNAVNSIHFVHVEQTVPAFNSFCEGLHINLNSSIGIRRSRYSM